MRAVHRRELAEKANRPADQDTPLAKLVREALADKELQLHAALRTRLEKSEYTAQVIPKPESARFQFEVRDQAGGLVAWADSDGPENAIEYALLGAMREGK